MKKYNMLKTLWILLGLLAIVWVTNVMAVNNMIFSIISGVFLGLWLSWSADKLFDE